MRQVEGGGFLVEEDQREPNPKPNTLILTLFDLLVEEDQHEGEQPSQVGLVPVETMMKPSSAPPGLHPSALTLEGTRRTERCPAGLMGYTWGGVWGMQLSPLKELDVRSDVLADEVLDEVPQGAD